MSLVLRKDHIDALKLDKGESMFLQKQLTFLESEVYGKDYPELKARQLFPVFSVGEGWETIEYTQMDKSGRAKIVGSKSTDSPLVDVALKSEQRQIKQISASYMYTHQELQRSARLQRPLDMERAMVCRESMEREADDIAFNGNVKANLPGLFSAEYLSQYSNPALTGNLQGLGVDQALTEVSNIINAVVTNSKGIYKANACIMGIADWTYLNTTRVGDTNITMLMFLQSAHPDITFDWSYKFDSVATANGRPVIMAMKRDSSVMKLHIPAEFQQLNIQAMDLGYKVPCLMDIAGLFVYRPKAIAYSENPSP